MGVWINGSEGGSLGNVGTVTTITNPVSLASQGYISTLSFTRPENTTAYGAGDVIGIADSGTPANAGSAIHTFTSIGPTAGHIMLTSVDLRIDLAAVTSGMTSFRLYLYDSSPTAILDNAAWDFVSGDRGKLLGYVDLGTPVDLVSTLFVQADNINRHIKLAAASTSLFGELVTNGAYTPTSAEAFTIRLRAVSL